MIEKPVLPDLAHCLQSLLTAVRERCVLHGRWGWLAAPMALVAWIGLRRMRREEALAMQAVAGLLEQLMAVVEDFRAGRLTAVPVAEAAGVDATPRPCAVPAVRPARRGGARRRCAMPEGAAPAPVSAGAEGVPMPAPLRQPPGPMPWRRARAGPPLLPERGRSAADGEGRARRPRTPALHRLAPRARPPPDALLQKAGVGVLGFVRAYCYDIATKSARPGGAVVGFAHPTQRAQSGLTLRQPLGDTS